MLYWRRKLKWKVLLLFYTENESWAEIIQFKVILHRLVLFQITAPGTWQAVFSSTLHILNKQKTIMKGKSKGLCQQISTCAPFLERLISESPDYRLIRCIDPLCHFIRPGRQCFSRKLQENLPRYQVARAKYSLFTFPTSSYKYSIQYISRKLLLQLGVPRLVEILNFVFFHSRKASCLK